MAQLVLLISALPAGKNAVCGCDEDHIEVSNGLERVCRSNPIEIGQECQNSRQCAKLEAKCRTVKDPNLNSNQVVRKVCQCFNTQRVDKDGICVDEKDRAKLEFGRLFRKPTFNEIFPGKKLLETSLILMKPQEKNMKTYEDGTNSGKIVLNCILSENLEGDRSGSSSYSLPFNKKGFELPFYVKGMKLTFRN